MFRKTNISYQPDTCTYVCVSGGKKCQFSGTFCVRTKCVIPKYSEIIPAFISGMKLIFWSVLGSAESAGFRNIVFFCKDCR